MKKGRVALGHKLPLDKASQSQQSVGVKSSKREPQRQALKAFQVRGMEKSGIMI